jgi:NAD(P)-dependent dehydrogenase (short-subunit alcohol dehydrogenase family)
MTTPSSPRLVGSDFNPVYSMAKFGMVGFVRALAKRLAGIVTVTKLA